jgi:hypothetical protein
MVEGRVEDGEVHWVRREMQQMRIIVFMEREIDCIIRSKV